MINEIVNTLFDVIEHEPGKLCKPKTIMGIISHWIIERIVLIIASITVSIALILIACLPFRHSGRSFMYVVNLISNKWLSYFHKKSIQP